MIYEVPDWAQPPHALRDDGTNSNNVAFEVFRMGCALETVELLPILRHIEDNNDELQSFIMIGRAPDEKMKPEGKSNYLICHHESISRCHCVIQFQGHDIFLFDLGSTHGTFVNKKKLNGLTVFIKQ